jgi:hypothetical protein
MKKLDQCPRRFLGIISWKPSVSESHRLLVVILWIFFPYFMSGIIISYILLKRWVTIPEGLNFNRLFLQLNRFIFHHSW